MSEKSEAETVIFNLQKKASLYLSVGDSDEFKRIQGTIAHLQTLFGAVKGVGGNNDRTS